MSADTRSDNPSPKLMQQGRCIHRCIHQSYGDERASLGGIGGDRNSEEASSRRQKHVENIANLGQIVSTGNDGKLINTDCFWSAAAQIVRECHAVLRPGAMCAWVVKDFCRAGRRVEFSRDWLRLLVACGFEPVLWVRASLITMQEEAGLFGGKVLRKKKKVSFFRRLHESKLPADDPRRIDEEVVLFVRSIPDAKEIHE